MKEIRSDGNTMKVYEDRITFKRRKSIFFFGLGLVYVFALITLISLVPGNYVMQIALCIPLFAFISHSWFWETYQLRTNDVLIIKYHFFFVPVKVVEQELNSDYSVTVHDRYQSTSGVVKKKGFLIILDWVTTSGVEKYKQLLTASSREKAEVITNEVQKWRVKREEY